MLVGASDNSVLAATLSACLPNASIVTLGPERAREAFTHKIDLSNWLQGDVDASYQNYEPGHFDILWFDCRILPIRDEQIYLAATRLKCKYYLVRAHERINVPDYEVPYIHTIRLYDGSWITTTLPMQGKEAVNLQNAEQESAIWKILIEVLLCALSEGPNTQDRA